MLAIHLLKQESVGKLNNVIRNVMVQRKLMEKKIADYRLHFPVISCL